MSIVYSNNYRQANGQYNSSAFDLQLGRVKAWFNMNGSGGVGFRRSHRCNSINDRGTGQYRVNYSVTIDGSHCLVLCADNVSANGNWTCLDYQGNTGVNNANFSDINSFNYVGSFIDQAVICGQVTTSSS